MILDFFDAVLVNLGRREGGDSAVNVRPEKRFELRLRFRAELIQRDRMVPEPFPVNFAEDGAEPFERRQVMVPDEIADFLPRFSVEKRPAVVQKVQARIGDRRFPMRFSVESDPLSLPRGAQQRVPLPAH